MLLAFPPDAAGGDSGGYEKVRFVTGGDAGEAGAWIRSDGEDCCGGDAAAAAAASLLPRLSVGEEGARGSGRSVPARSSSVFQVGTVGCDERCGAMNGTVRRWGERNVGALLVSVAMSESLLQVRKTEASTDLTTGKDQLVLSPFFRRRKC